MKHDYLILLAMCWSYFWWLPGEVQAVEERAWERTLGGKDHDKIDSIQQTIDGGFIGAGSTNSKGAGASDAWIFKLNADGELLWERTFGGELDDSAKHIQQTTDGGFIVSGRTESKETDGPVGWILKLASDGKLSWERTFKGKGSGNLYVIQQTADSGFVVAGSTFSESESKTDAWVLKLSVDGSPLWERIFEGGQNGGAYSVQQTTDSGFIVTGSTGVKETGGEDVWVMKFSPNGERLWDRIFGGDADDSATSIQQTTDGGFILAGSTESKGVGASDAWLLKLSADGKLLWDRTFGRAQDDYATAIKQTTDGGFVVVGFHHSQEPRDDFDIWVLRLSADGKFLWDRSLGGSLFDSSSSIQQTTDGGYVVGGTTSSERNGNFNAFVAKLGRNGESEEGLFLRHIAMATTPNRLYLLGFSYEGQSKDRARVVYQELMKRFPDSDLAIKATDRLIALSSASDQGSSNSQDWVGRRVSYSRVYSYKVGTGSEIANAITGGGITEKFEVTFSAVVEADLGDTVKVIVKDAAITKGKTSIAGVDSARYYSRKVISDAMGETRILEKSEVIQ